MRPQLNGSSLLCAALLAITSVSAGAACSDSTTPPPATKPVDPTDQRPDLDASPDLPSTPRVCEPNGARCRDVSARLICAADGQSEREEPCGQGLRCQEETGQCLAALCTPGRFDVCTDDGLQRYCNTSGTAWIEAPCPGGAPCAQGRCQAPECVSGVIRCIDPRSLQVCNEAGAYVPGPLCPLGTECFNGTCEPLCELNKKVSSYVGCEYWSVDLDNYDDAQSQPHAVVVANPNPTLSARVEIFEGFSQRKLLTDADGLPFDPLIPPGQQRIYSIPTGYDHSGTRQLTDKALRVTSSIPIVAHQFNPLNNVSVYSNDGTLLIPTNALDREYWGMSWPHRGGRARIRGFLTIVNTTGAPNRVSVKPSAEVAAGPDIPTLTPGVERVFELGPGDSLSLSTSGAEFDEALISGCLQPTEGVPPSMSPCPDLTGTHIKAEQPIMVFGGHQCANVVLGIDRCDHIESTLFPVSSWGTDYVGTKFSPRAPTANTEPDLWRLIAAEDNTQILTDPPIEGIHGRTLMAGQWRQFEARQGFRLGASKPVMLAQFMVGANWLGIPRVCDQGQDAASPVGIGDPAMALSVPTGQYRDDYFILVPKDYREDYLNIIAPPGARVTLDEQPLDPALFKPVGARGEWTSAIVKVPDGYHRLRGDVPFGVVSYGYDCRVSYATPGGLNLERLGQPRPPQ